MVALNGLPPLLSGYRERGILRRLRTTPVGALRLVAAQLAVYLVMAVCSTLLLLVIGRAVFGVGLPNQWLLVIAAALVLTSGWYGIFAWTGYVFSALAIADLRARAAGVAATALERACRGSRAPSAGVRRALPPRAPARRAGGAARRSPQATPEVGEHDRAPADPRADAAGGHAAVLGGAEQ